MKVSIENLEQATEQQVFDHIKNHLLSQGERSMKSEELCGYRGQGGTICAAGCLIPDDVYNEDWESKCWRSLVVDEGVSPYHGTLILEMQMIHDKVMPEHWEDALKDLAQRKGLE